MIEWEMLTSGDQSYYSSGALRISILDAHAWGDYGHYVTAHEHGHYFGINLLGMFRDGSCPSPHEINTAYNCGCAYEEGFANYYAALLRGPELGYWYDAFEFVSLPLGQDGAATESAVAGFLLDLSDGSNDGWDDINFGAPYVAELLDTCEITVENIAWVTANGIDDAVYCFERRIDPAITGSSVYFPNRTDPLGQRSTTSSAPDADKIRLIWRQNLYQGR